MATSGGGSFYHRPVDRSPEHQSFFQLPGYDQELISNLRAARLNVHQKVNEMRDQLCSQEREIEKETRRRKNAESMVDMYGSPEMASELRTRLNIGQSASHKLPSKEYSPEDSKFKLDSSVRDLEIPVSSSPLQQSTPRDKAATTESLPIQSSLPNIPSLPTAALPYTVLTQLPPVAVLAYPAASGFPQQQSPRSGDVTAVLSDSKSTQASPRDPEEGNSFSSQHRAGANRHVTVLLGELEKSRNREAELRLELDRAKRELDFARLAAETATDERVENELSRVGDLVADLHNAQRDRESALLGRLKLANQDRDAALLRAQRLASSSFPSSAATSSFPTNLSALLDKMENENDPVRLRSLGEQLLRGTREHQKQSKMDHSQGQAALEKELSEAKVTIRKLEDELKSQRRTKHNGSDETQHAQLVAAERARDLAHARIAQVEEENQTLKVYYNLHQSLSNEKGVRDRFNTALHELQGGNAKVNDQERSQQEKDDLRARLDEAQREKEALMAEILRAQERNQKQAQDTERLQRLVAVLRKKVAAAASDA